MCLQKLSLHLGCAVVVQRSVRMLLLITAGKLDTSKQAVQPFLDGGSLQLRCERAVGKGDTLLTVPDNLWLSPKAVADSSIGPLVEGLPFWLQACHCYGLIHRVASARQPRAPA